MHGGRLAVPFRVCRESGVFQLNSSEASLVYTTCLVLDQEDNADTMSSQAAVAALAGGSDCAVFSDEMNHASIIDGARLAKASGASLHIYRHNDMAHLAKLLAEVPCGVRKMVVTDSLFSMDGTCLWTPMVDSGLCFLSDRGGRRTSYMSQGRAW